MKISIVGTGYVGLVTGACLASRGHQVSCVDIDQAKIDNLKRGEIPIFEPGLNEVVKEGINRGALTFTTSAKDSVANAQVVFLAVGTPPAEDGSADLKYVFQAVEDISPHLPNECVVVSKSTVPVGTNRKISEKFKLESEKTVFVASNPEFLREGKAIDDFMNPDRIVLGVDEPKAGLILKEVYKDFDCPIVETSIESAEMIKYASNAFLATKISFINEIANICEGVDANVKDVSKGMGLDPRIGEAFLSAGIGYGGSCFPKDVRALDQIAGLNGYDFKLLKSVIQVNNDQRWRFYKKIEGTLNPPHFPASPAGRQGGAGGGCRSFEGKKIAVLGLAFKAGTDDIRESIGIDFALKLIEDGSQVSVYDPQAMDNAREVLDGVEFCNSIEEAVDGSDAIVITTEWQEFRDFDFSKIADRLKQKNIFDGRNLSDPDCMQSLGIKYFGVGL
ncbi:UDP-glucose/GDP-mannose dehydrogenase family protein [Candidatus Uhrbacteria bacterium]|jgi:UDPglucose 6-dehydrogenase|nr:UDP-glucose/GDP-mannose dehydrogenase family protein [Candidatus Uhrbacteria bacterium]MBT7717754.1 UDP-glucose/GDP-mannose dehydrogenase family protein [Candidatus Uhrbacteria bacterium]